MLLNNKVILVTGSTDGIGEAVARHCVEQGACVMIHGRREEKAQRVCHSLGDKAAYFIGDLTDTSNCENLVAATVKHFGRIDGLVNNAGVCTRSDIDSSDEAMFDTLINTNLKAPLLLTRATVKQLRQQQTAGAIVNIGSINAYCGEPVLLVYSMSKGGLMTMTRNLADALGPEGIRINQLNVGWTATRNEDKLKQQDGLPANWQSLVPQQYAPRGHILAPEDIGPHVVFWLSEQSVPVTGAVYEVEQYPVVGRNRLCDLELG